jgi:hypothetical protein
LHQQNGIKFKKETTLNAMRGAQLVTVLKVGHRKVDQKYLESFEMWLWRGKEELILTNRVKAEEVLQRVKEKMKFLHIVKRRKVNWIENVSLGTAL